MTLLDTERRPGSIRRVYRVPAGTAGAVAALGSHFKAETLEDWTSGDYELRILEEGKGTLTIPAADGLALSRFLCFTDPNYQAGDEWLELHEGDQPGLDEPLFVGTITGADVGTGSITLEHADALEVWKTIRETLGLWRHAPRDVFEHYCRHWVPVVAERPGETYPTGWGLLFGTAVPSPVDPKALRVTDGALRTAATVFDQFDPVWRLELELDVLSIGSYLQVGLFDGSANMRLVPGAVGGTLMAWTSALEAAPLPAGEVYGRHRFVIERRYEWVLFYFNGRLVAVLPAGTAGTGAQRIYPCWLNTTGSVDVRTVLLRRGDPALLGRTLERGDYHLPGAPTPGGLVGSYFDDVPLQVHAIADQHSRATIPTRDVVARRLDPTIKFSDSVASGVPWVPSNVPPSRWTAIWTGSVYLDLAASDRQIRVKDVKGGVRVRIGKTLHLADLLVNEWSNLGLRTITPAGGLRAHLGTKAGFYPIVIEHKKSSTGDGLHLEDSALDGGGAPIAWTTVPTARLSPQGIYEQRVAQGDSHYEQIAEQARTFGLQYRLMPKGLESGAFPGELVPRVRVGRDTAKILEPPETLDRGRKLDFRQTVTGLLIDAAGLGTDGAQVTLEELDFDELGEHAFLNVDQLSLSDLTVPAVVRARARTLMTLRRTALEDIGLRIRGSTELVDSWPLTGILARLRWEPGDGVRVRDEALGLDDQAPRYITAVKRAFGHHAIGDPALSFRPRPRSPRAALRELSRTVLGQRRQYQGQLAKVSGNMASNPATAVMPDVASRVAYPVNPADVYRAELIVHLKSDASTWTIALNGGGAIEPRIFGPGRIDVTAAFRRDGANQRAYATVAGGTGLVEFQLELTVRIPA